MKHAVIEGHRRFTCLADDLVRMEFSPSGTFEDRPSMVAAGEKTSKPFRTVRREGGTLILETKALTVFSRENDKAFFPDNLEVRWWQDELLQPWRPGDFDYQNLGGTVRSLDNLDRNAALTGAHPADMQPPDAHSMAWHAWNMCEVDPYYLEESGIKSGIHGIHGAIRHGTRPELVRTANHALDEYRYAPGVLSRSGYFFLNDSTSAVLDQTGNPVDRDTPGTQDWYFLCHRRDYGRAMRLWRILAGPAPLPPKHAFGLFFSRWPAYDETEAKEIVERFQDEGIPLSVLVLDMEWHKEGWCHWDWDQKAYPDPNAFFNWCHRRGLLVTLNVHPLHVREDDSHFRPYLDATGRHDEVDERTEGTNRFGKIDVDICDPEQADPFMAICHKPIVDEGLDFWWVDGSQGTINGTSDQLVTSMRYFQNVDSARKRGCLLSRYGGLGTHRYGIYFTGDTACQWEVLQTQCEFNIRAGHVGMAYVSHDIGGFAHPSTPLIDPIMYIRWLQFGVFNPVFRFHSCPGAGSRQPWDYGDHNYRIAHEWLSLRNSLMPTIYAAARRHHDTGVPMVRGVFFDWPEDEAAYRYDEFLFGDALLVAPVLGPDDAREVYLPAGDWFEYGTGRRVEGGRTFNELSPLNRIPLYAKAGSILLRQAPDASPVQRHVDELIVEAFPGRAARAELYEDDGRSGQYADEAKVARTTVRMKSSKAELTLTIDPLKGTPQGPARRVRVEVPAEALPKQALRNGKAIAQSRIEHDPKRGRIVVDAGSMTVETGMDIAIRFA